MVKKLPAGFVPPAQPVEATKPPAGPDWVHEIKHDGYRMIVRRDDTKVWLTKVWLWTRNAVDYTGRMPAITAAAARLKAASFTIDGEAVVTGPTGSPGLTSFATGPAPLPRSSSRSISST
jgi:ATP-dependent DNA ligase